MIFSLERRFLLLLLIPVAVILITVGVVGWMFGRSLILDQWIDSTRLRLEKAAHQITMHMDEKPELIKLIAKAEEVPNNAVVQGFLIQQLVEKEEVRFVDIELFDNTDPGSGEKPDPYTAVAAEGGLYVMELWDYGSYAPTMDPQSSDRSLKIVKLMGENNEQIRRLVVRINFDSLLEPIKQMGLWEGATACLAASTGQVLAHTDKAMHDRKSLGETGDPLELNLLKEIREKPFGHVCGKGYPPDRVAVFLKMPFINWYLVLFSKGSVILAPILRFVCYFAIGAIASLVAILLLIRVTTRPVSKSIAQISEAAAKVRNGDYEVELPEETRDEVGQLGASFKKMTEGLKQRDLIEQTFGRYVDKKVAEELMSRPEALRLGGEKRTVTIMMSDLRNFTVVSEKLEPEEVIKMLNRYFARMIELIERYSGIIVDFYGDSILVFFNGLEADIDARALDALRCALEMQQEFEKFVTENVRQGLPVLAMGIGIHTGEVIVGNIGTESRAKYGIVGSDVNLTDRIQATAGGGKIVISERTYDVISDFVEVSLEFKARLKGVEEIRQLYEIESVNSDLQSKRKPIYPSKRPALSDRDFQGGTTIEVY
jgi:adenylate cyclase